MGQFASVIKALSCADCVRYVCNSMHVNPKCSDCCELDFVTDEVHVNDDDSETEIEVIGCCVARHA